MSTDYRCDVYIEFVCDPIKDKSFLDTWMDNLVSNYGVDEKELDVRFDTMDKPSMMWFELIGNNGIDYTMIDLFKDYFEKYQDLLISCHEWIATGEGFFYEKIEGEEQ